MEEDWLTEYLNNHRPVWYRRLMPWLPRAYRIKELRLFIFEWADCTRISVPVFKKKYHFVDKFVRAHRKWHQFPISGFQIWY